MCPALIVPMACLFVVVFHAFMWRGFKSQIYVTGFVKKDCIPEHLHFLYAHLYPVMSMSDDYRIFHKKVVWCTLT